MYSLHYPCTVHPSWQSWLWSFSFLLFYHSFCILFQAVALTMELSIERVSAVLEGGQPQAVVFVQEPPAGSAASVCFLLEILLQLPDASEPDTHELVLDLQPLAAPSTRVYCIPLGQFLGVLWVCQPVPSSKHCRSGSACHKTLQLQLHWVPTLCCGSSWLNEPDCVWQPRLVALW